jgi:hypothetical protein
MKTKAATKTATKSKKPQVKVQDMKPRKNATGGANNLKQLGLATHQ